MNVLFLLTPKAEVDYVVEDFTVKQAIEKMNLHGYTAIPVISKSGKYLGSISSNDLLKALQKNSHITITELGNLKINEIKRHKDNAPVPVNAKLEDLVSKAANENFVPVVDDKKVFIGIIKRSDLIEFGYKQYKSLIKERNKFKEPLIN